MAKEVLSSIVSGLWPEEDRAQIAGLDEGQARSVLRDVLTTLDRNVTDDEAAAVERILATELERSGGPIDALSLPRVSPKTALWRGDITKLRIDAVVNPANSGMLGCFQPEHRCLDNVIHAQAGPRLRASCRAVMAWQKWQPEPPGRVKVTPAFSLPSRFVFHTVGPVWQEYDDKEVACDVLRSCYKSILAEMRLRGLRSVALCCISTGIFGFPQEIAARIALSEAKSFLSDPENEASVDLILFDVWLESDLAIYSELFPKFFQ